MQTTDLSPEIRARIAEYEVLVAYDRRRCCAYGDMANARRGREINRRGDALIVNDGVRVDREGHFPSVSIDELRAAFERLLLPRYRRFRKSPGVTWRKGMTREAQATQRVFERLAREYGVELEPEPAPERDERLDLGQTAVGDVPAHVGPADTDHPTLLNYPTLVEAYDAQVRRIRRVLEDPKRKGEIVAGYSVRIYVGHEDAPRFVGRIVFDGFEGGEATIRFDGSEAQGARALTRRESQRAAAALEVSR